MTRAILTLEAGARLRSFLIPRVARVDFLPIAKGEQKRKMRLMTADDPKWGASAFQKKILWARFRNRLLSNILTILAPQKKDSGGRKKMIFEVETSLWVGVAVLSSLFVLA